MFLVAVLACQLQGRFIGFRPRVAEEDPLGKGVLTEPLCQLNLLRDMIEIGAMQQTSCLLAQGGDHPGVAMAKIVNGHSGEKVEICFAINIPQSATFAAFCDDWVATIGFHDMFICSVNPLL